MNIKPGQISAASFLQRSESLLKSAARLMEVDLEVRIDDGAVLPSAGPLPGCLSCGHSMPAQHHACEQKRQARCRAAASRLETAEWSCPDHMVLTVHPIPGREGAAGALLCIDPMPGFGGFPDQPGIAKAVVEIPPARHAFLQDLAQLLSDQMFLFREMSSLAGELSTRYDELQMLYAIAGRLTHHEDLRQTLRHTLEQARATVEADAALLEVADRRLRETVVRGGLTGVDAGNRQAWARLAQALSDLTLQGGRPFYLGNPWDAAGQSNPFPRPAQALAVTVGRNGHRAGVLALLHFDPHQGFRSSDIKLLESVSEQVAMAITNAELYEDLKGFLMATVKSLVGAIEAKDSYTSGHSERVNLISMLIGKKMNLSEPEMETLRWASILHDVGKIGMPEQILCKPGKLTVGEYEIIKQHPDRGYRLLAPISQLSEAAVIVRSHHEMVDGGGYPEALQGEAIPELARIIAVADTFDALTSDRPYRSARTLDFALEEIQRVRGVQLDDRVVDTFLELVPFLREHRVMIHPDDAEAVEDEAA